MILWRSQKINICAEHYGTKLTHVYSNFYLLIIYFDFFVGRQCIESSMILIQLNNHEEMNTVDDISAQVLIFSCFILNWSDALNIF